jgi:hypothetical protein
MAALTFGSLGAVGLISFIRSSSTAARLAFFVAVALVADTLPVMGALPTPITSIISAGETEGINSVVASAAAGSIFLIIIHLLSMCNIRVFLKVPNCVIPAGFKPEPDFNWLKRLDPR